MRWVVVAAVGVAGAVALVLAVGGGEKNEPGGRTQAESRPKPKPPPELPGGGRRIFPDRRLVAFYGAPQAAGLGVLGIGTPAQAGRKLRRVARRYDRRSRPVLPAMELIATVAAGAPHGGRYSYRQSPATIDRYLRAARKAGALLILDVQPGRVGFMREVRRLRPWLKQPDVGLALDPEWHVGPAQIPGKTLGSVDGAEVDRVARYLSSLAGRGPQKLLLVHQFTESMVRNRHRVRRRPGVATVINADGFGAAPDKVSVYRRLAPRRLHRGFKLFYEEDEGLMSPAEVLALRPRPDVVVYE